MASLFLLGFMACGKTTVGPVLADRLGFAFVDLDEVIAKAAGESVADIIQGRGESVFRELEYRALRSCAGHELVIAGGGGSYIPSENRAFLRSAGVVGIFLNLPWSVLAARAAGGDRPLWKDADGAQELFRRRLPIYREAEMILDLSGSESPLEIVDQIVSGLEETSCDT